MSSRDLNDLLQDDELPDDLGLGAADFDEWERADRQCEGSAKLSSVLRIDSLEELALIAAQPVEWWIEKIIPRGQLTLVAGAPKAGKSTLLLGIAMVLCTCLRHFAGFVGAKSSVRVMWLYEDAKRTMARRIAAHGIDAGILPVGYRDAATKGIGKIAPIELADALVRYAAQHGAKVLIIDTLRRWFRLDENNDEEADALIAALQAAAEAEGVAVVVVHHTRKLGHAARTPTLEDVRGTSALTAAADHIVIVHRKSRGDTLAPVMVLVEGRDLDHGFRVVLQPSEDGRWERLQDTRAATAEEKTTSLIDAVVAVHAETRKPVSRTKALKQFRGSGGKASNEVASALLTAAVEQGHLRMKGTSYLPAEAQS